MRRRGWIFLLTAIHVVLLCVFAYMMDKYSFVAVEDLPVRDPASVGASVMDTQSMVKGGPELLSDGGSTDIGASFEQRVPSPLFWMAAGAACVCVGILLATARRPRERMLFAKKRS